MQLPKTYIAKDYENDIYKMWEDTGVFSPSKHGEPFSIVLPPPNATGKLHVGHSAMIAISDTVVRYQRMAGKSVLWIPGTDHAAIATQSVVERELEKEGTSRHDLGRDKFLDRVQSFVDESIDTIRSQTKAMGASVDWSRERYTMEPAMNRVVSQVFMQMYKDGLIYRGPRIVNWDPKMETVVADDELEHVEEKTTFYTFKYGPFEIGTARPETKFGDKYVVVHPDDERYAKYKHGYKFEAEWINGKINATLIKDEAIDPEFGTGAMTITPWHDPVDFEIAERHNLEKEQIIDFKGNLLKIAGEFKGMNINEARSKIVEKLNSKGLLVNRDDNYIHNISINYRGKGVIEPQIKDQWFIDVNKQIIKWKGSELSLKEIMQDVIKDKDIDILPDRFNKMYFHWIDNLRDWCISRQIWWGHRIPAYYSTASDGEPQIAVGEKPPADKGWEQDPDTLDTWFSSGLWTWSTLIDPQVALDEKNSLHDMLKKSPDYKRFHPNSLMETGWDILFFWVARMILMTTYITGEIPFKTVYLHGMVRTKDGSKMSKSHPEAAIDPMDVIPKYGTDALRLSLLVGQTPGSDMRIYEDKIASYRNFCNKLWNIARFIEDKLLDGYKLSKPKPKSSADYWILKRLGEATRDIASQIENYELGRAYEDIYHFIWDDFADWYIEASKIETNPSVLAYVLDTCLKITHPFAPFVTEAIWNTLEWEKEPLIAASWPKVDIPKEKHLHDFAELITIVKEIRHLRQKMQLSENYLYYKNSPFISDHDTLITHLTGLHGCKEVEDGKGLHLTQTSYDCWIDVEEQHAHDYLMNLVRKRESKRKRIKGLEARLKNKAYVRSAPKEIVNQTKEELETEQAQLSRIELEVEAFEHAIKQD